MEFAGPLAGLYPAVHQCLKSAVPEFWPGLGQLVDRLLARRRPEALLPLASCQAAGGDPVLAIPVAAAIVATEIALIILDDVNDRDRPVALFQHVGVERARNFSSAFQTLSVRVLMDAAWPADTCTRVVRALGSGYLAMAAGQERDLSVAPHDLESYWAIAEMKTGAGYATAMEAGALVATRDDEPLLTALRTFGYHTGLAVQVFNDLRGIWAPDGDSDLVRGKITLPVVYALSCEHVDRGLLQAIVNDGQMARHHQTIRQILDRIDVRAFLVWAALQHRDKALQALAPVPGGAGTIFLNDFITGCFGNIDELLQDSSEMVRADAGPAHEILGRDVPASAAVGFAPTPVYRSAGLSMRRSLRGES